MRIKILADVATVGRRYKAGEVAEVQEPLALALVRGGKAVPADGSALPAPVAAEEIVEESVLYSIAEVGRLVPDPTFSKAAHAMEPKKAPAKKKVTKK